MAQPIPLQLPPHDPREELRKRLEQAPHQVLSAASRNDRQLRIWQGCRAHSAAVPGGSNGLCWVRS